MKEEQEGMEYLGVSHILMDIERRLRSVTDAQIRRAEEKLDKAGENEKSLGIITSPLIKRLYIASNQFKRAAMRIAADSADADSQEDEDRLKEEAERAKELAELTSELFWNEIRADLGIFREQALGIRESWMVVGQVKGDHHHIVQQIIQSLGGKDE